MRDRIFQPRLTFLPPSYPPKRWIETYLPLYEEAGLVLDQGAEGACTGFGLAALINYVQFRREIEASRQEERDTQLPGVVSPRMAYHLARIYDEWPGEDYEGSSCRGAMKGWFHHGICSDALWPYRRRGQVAFVQPKLGWAADAATRPLGAYYRIIHDAIPDLQAAIAEVGAIYVSACVHDGWQVAGEAKKTQRRRTKTAPQLSGVPTIAWSPERATNGGHAFALVGYDDEGFIIQNSWGPDWGFHGFARLTYPDWLTNGMDAWVATLSAPIRGEAPAIVLSAGRTIPATAPDLKRGLAGGITAGAVAATASDSNWSLEQTSQHALVLANDGRLASQIVIDAADAADAAKRVGRALPGEWLAGPAGKSGKIALYVHGGLNDLRASLARAKVLGPCLTSNEIYPIFVCWQSGYLDSLKNIIGDTIEDIFGTAPDPRSKQAQGFFEDARDRALETFAIPAARPIWQQMKQNAVAATEREGGAAYLVEQLAILAKAHPNLEVHLVGHSAGAIMIGPLLDLLRSRRIKVGSLSLFAPACTVDFANIYYARHIGTTVPAGKVSIDILSDPIEQSDSVGPYGKSLLYLVSRALENTHKTPILGLEAVWRPELDRKDLMANPQKRGLGAVTAAEAIRPPKSVEVWRQHWSGWKGATLKILGERQVWDGAKAIPANHSCFDNWQGCMAATIERIRGGKLKAQLLPLVDF
ncbi:C1 family peptidase [Microvirga pakistanensis]|uniref:C1 family peptidase n=1 Tax=Microvirga pakistanensis TaxID=1682650 RepID=UPI00141BBBEE|nr:C1 family peptidase [Microvirga pakistanensis]